MNRELFDFVNYAPDEGKGGDLELEGVFSTEGTEEEEFFLEGDPNIPIVQKPAEEDSPELKAMKDQNEILTQQMATLQTQADSTAALTKGLDNLGQSLRTPVPQVQTPIDPLIAEKEFNDKFYDNPLQNLIGFNKEKIAPLIGQLMATNASNAKQFLLLDPTRAEVYKKYGPEVEQVFEALPPEKKLQDPNAYKEAADIISTRHMPETMASMKEQLRKEIMEELGKEGNDPSGEPALHSESGVTKRVNTKTKSHILPNAVWDYAGLRGWQARGEKADRARIYQWWKEGKLPGAGIEYK